MARRSDRGEILAWFGLALGAALALLPGVSRSAQERPSFVFVISDDQRWDCIGAAGNPNVRTPALDRLAAEGVYFRQATVVVPQCSPVRSSLLTGLPPHQHGHYSNQYQSAAAQQRDGFSRFPCTPALLRDAGYRTVLVGKWHPAPDPWNCGFSDVRLWLPGGGGPYQDPALARGNSRKTEPTQGYTNELFVDDALAFLKSDAAREKPFFLWLAMTEPHLPQQPVPERIAQQYAGKQAADLAPPGFPGDVRTLGGNWLNYYQSITHLDEQVGRVLDTLKERSLDSKTVVAFLGDNGYMMGSRGRNGKVVPYEESVRVPLIVRAPMIQKTRGTSEAPVSSLDLPPTFLRIAGVTPPMTWAGRDLTPLLRGEKAPIDEAVCEWADNQSAQFGQLGYRVVRTPTHKLIRWEQADKPDELYDLRADPREEKNLAGAAPSAAVRDDLLKRLQAWMDRTEDPARGWKK